MQHHENWPGTRVPLLLPEGAAGPHVLVVDDEPQIRELLSTALRREGYRVTARPDAETALEEVRRSGVNILVTDLKMPRVSGLELIRSAKRINPDLGSVLITAFSSTETAVQALRYGADDYLTKPFGLDDLRSVVSRVLTSRRMVRDERSSLDRARREASSLRQRHRVAEQALEQAQHDLSGSRRELRARVRDLDFVRELTFLLSRKGGLQRMLHTTAEILTRRFGAYVTRIELELSDGVHVADSQQGEVPARILAAMGPDLVARARVRPGGVLRDLVLGYGPPLEGMAASLRVGDRSVGGITILRASPESHEEAGDTFLLSLVPQALAIAIENELNRQAAEKNALGVAMGMLEILEGRGTLYAGHSDRVARISAAIAEELDVSPRLRRVIDIAARLHDVGEVGIPDGVLQRTGPLSQTEQEIVRTHPEIGARLLAPFGEAASFVRHHHERADGQGYPDGLAGDQIPLGAAIIGVAEAFDAMTSPRPYRLSRSRREALDEIRQLRGTQFVPEVVDGLLAVPRESL